jgi:hypothetical protein
LRHVREHLTIKIPNQALPIRICHRPHCPNDTPESATLPHGTPSRGERTLGVDLARTRERGSQGGECCTAVRHCPGGWRQRSIQRGERRAGIGAGESEFDQHGAEEKGAVVVGESAMKARRLCSRSRSRASACRPCLFIRIKTSCTRASRGVLLVVAMGECQRPTVSTYKTGASAPTGSPSGIFKIYVIVTHSFHRDPPGDISRDGFAESKIEL